MNESNINQQNSGAALDAVLDRHSRGELIGDQSISLASLLRQRLPDLKELSKDHSASAIASALTQEGFTVSASSVQRVLQEATPKRKLRTPHATDVTKVVKPIASAPVAAQQKMTDAEALLKQMCQEDNNTTQQTENKRIATLK